ncbi:MAG TPA: glycosyltransferase [Solirubrobacteraceae bacterium]|nr:glycosyltransferase [Solirubrobacteraceae bacterium]
MRALIFTNLYPSARDPVRGSFVRDQVEALRRIPELELELFTFGSLGAGGYLAAGRDAHRRYRGARFDVVHAHFGLNIWPSLAVRADVHGVTLHGTDLVHPRSRAITSAGLPFMKLVGPVSASLEGLLPRRGVRGRVEVLPCGVDLHRFRRIERREARKTLGLDESGPYLLFPANPARPEKRYDRAQEVAGEAPLLVLDGVDPSQVPLWVNAANAVLVPSERESFGLAVLEALACDVPVLATPVGVAPEVLSGVEGAYCREFDAPGWRELVTGLIGQEDPRVEGRPAAARYSAERMADRVYAAWESLV